MLYVVVIFSWSFYKTYKSKKVVMVLLLPLLSFLMHISYGVGFLTGILKFD
jgi:hypothetical protein